MTERALKQLYALVPHSTVALGLAAALGIAGCGTPGAPLAPSLKLPARVSNLTASRTGNEVALAWTMPRRTTDKLLIKGDVPVHICRREGAETCQPLRGVLSFAPNAKAGFTQALPTAAASGAPRLLTYYVELHNSNGRSAGPSNAAAVLAGEAPPAIVGLTAEVRKAGVILSWNQDGLGEAQKIPGDVVVRLERRLLTPQLKSEPAGKGVQQGFFAPAAEPVGMSLLVEAPSGDRVPDRTIDKAIRFGNSYEYRAQRVERAKVGEQTLELAGPLSEPVRVDARDVFPPDVPTGLAAVATVANAGAGPSIDLSWQPVTDSDLAGYAVYRREGEGAWQRISPTDLVVGPGYHDAQVQQGHTYQYAVTAIDQSGHESARSDRTEESVPNS